MHDVGMGFLDLVKEHYGIGTAPDRFGKLAAFFITDIAGRRTDQSGSGELLHVFRHVDLDEGVGISGHKFMTASSWPMTCCLVAFHGEKLLRLLLFHLLERNGWSPSK